MFPLIQLAQGLEIPSFFLVISITISLSLFWIVRRSKLYQLPVKRVLDLSLLLMITSLVGSRLMHVFYESPEYYRENPEKIFYLWEGGFVFYGGLALALFSGFIYLRFAQIAKPGKYFDAFAPVISFAYGFGRVGCFLAGCCYGKFCEYPWAVAGRHPTQLYAFFWEAGTILLLLGLEKIELPQRPRFLSRSGDLFILWLACYSVGRILMESYREDFRGEQILGYSISTVFSVAMLFIAVALLMGLARNGSFRIFGKIRE